jgi:hypothetical protein
MKIGTVRPILNLLGKTPVEILRLKIWDRGWLLSVAMDLKEFCAGSFQVKTCFGSKKAFVVEPTTAGDMRPNSSVGGLFN